MYCAVSDSIIPSICMIWALGNLGGGGECFFHVLTNPFSQSVLGVFFSVGLTDKMGGVGVKDGRS